MRFGTLKTTYLTSVSDIDFITNLKALCICSMQSCAVLNGSSIGNNEQCSVRKYLDTNAFVVFYCKKQILFNKNIQTEQLLQDIQRLLQRT